MEVRDAGLIYRNPKPYLRGRHAFHPSLVHLGGDEMLCSFDIGEAVESLDYRTYRSRSRDGGRTWELEGPLFEARGDRATSSTVRIARLPDGRLVGFGARFYRDDPEEGLQNRATLGMVPMDLILLRSDNDGHTWSPPETVAPPLVGPAFEVCHRFLALPDGRWLAPTGTWRGWDGAAPSGEKAIVLISADEGRTWPGYVVTFDGTDGGVIHWEQSVVPLADGRLLAVAWAHDPKSGRNLPTPYTISTDGGRTFATPRPTGLHGQTCKALPLPGDRILCVYRRDDRPGLWANLAHLDGDRWINDAEAPLWGAALASSGMIGAANSSDELSRLRFGYPSPILLPDGDVLVAFWCVEECVANIRWLRVAMGLSGSRMAVR